MPAWIEVILRTMSAVVILFVLTKILGKRQVSQLSLFEYITGITIGSMAAYVSLEIDGSWHLGIISLCVWAGVSLVMEYLQLKTEGSRYNGWTRDGFDSKREDIGGAIKKRAPIY